MKFFFIISAPDQKHRDKSFTRSITAFTLDNPPEPGRPGFIQFTLRMTYMNQSLDLIKAAIEEKVGQQIELDGGYFLDKKP